MKTWISYGFYRTFVLYEMLRPKRVLHLQKGKKYYVMFVNSFNVQNTLVDLIHKEK